MNSKHDNMKQQFHNMWNEMAGTGMRFDEKMAKLADWHIAQLEAAKAEAELKREIKIHDEYWHSQKLVSENGIGPVALANKEAAEIQLAQLTNLTKQQEG